jgi:hypothetical protein
VVEDIRVTHPAEACHRRDAATLEFEVVFREIPLVF